MNIPSSQPKTLKDLLNQVNLNVRLENSETAPKIDLQVFLHTNNTDNKYFNDISEINYQNTLQTTSSLEFPFSQNTSPNCQFQQKINQNIKLQMPKQNSKNKNNLPQKYLERLRFINSQTNDHLLKQKLRIGNDSQQQMTNLDISPNASRIKTSKSSANIINKSTSSILDQLKTKSPYNKNNLTQSFQENNSHSPATDLNQKSREPQKNNHNVFQKLQYNNYNNNKNNKTNANSNPNNQSSNNNGKIQKIKDFLQNKENQFHSQQIQKENELKSNQNHNLQCQQQQQQIMLHQPLLNIDQNLNFKNNNHNNAQEQIYLQQEQQKEINKNMIKEKARKVAVKNTVSHIYIDINTLQSQNFPLKQNKTPNDQENKQQKALNKPNSDNKNKNNFNQYQTQIQQLDFSQNMSQNLNTQNQFTQQDFQYEDSVQSPLSNQQFLIQQQVQNQQNQFNSLYQNQQIVTSEPVIEYSESPKFTKSFSNPSNIEKKSIIIPKLDLQNKLNQYINSVSSYSDYNGNNNNYYYNTNNESHELQKESQLYTDQTNSEQNSPYQKCPENLTIQSIHNHDFKLQFQANQQYDSYTTNTNNFYQNNYSPLNQEQDDNSINNTQQNNQNELSFSPQMKVCQPSHNNSSNINNITRQSKQMTRYSSVSSITSQQLGQTMFESKKIQNILEDQVKALQNRIKKLQTDDNKIQKKMNQAAKSIQQQNSDNSFYNQKKKSVQELQHRREMEKQYLFQKNQQEQQKRKMSKEQQLKKYVDSKMQNAQHVKQKSILNKSIQQEQYQNELLQNRRKSQNIKEQRKSISESQMNKQKQIQLQNASNFVEKLKDNQQINLQLQEKIQQLEQMESSLVERIQSTYSSNLNQLQKLQSFDNGPSNNLFNNRVL